MQNQEAVKSGDRVTVLPLDRIEGRDGRVWTLTKEDAQTLIDRLKSDGVDVPVDFEHGSYSGNGRAAGWLKDFRLDPEGLTAVIEFTPVGQEAVDSREFRYLSPAFVSEGERILGLESVGLTNMPNIAALPALNSRIPTQAADVELGALRRENGELRLEINRLRTELDRRAQDFRVRELNGLLDRAVTEGRLAPAGREAALRLGLASHADLTRLIAATPPYLNSLTVSVAGPDAAVPQLDETESRMCGLLGLAPGEYAACRA